nr:hypothetical protein [Tanacetum cinerariifolium]
AQAKDIVILKLKEKLNSLKGDVKDRDEKRNVEESETLNIELGHQVNLKSVEVFDLNARLQEKVLVVTALKEQLDKLKGKAISTEAITLNPIDPKLLKVNVTPVVPKLRKNRTAHIDYIRHTQGEATTLRKIVESKRLLSPLNTSLDYACKVFKTVGHIWKPTGRTFTLVRNVCPLTRIATPTIVPPREPIPIVNKTDKPVVTLIMGYEDYQIGNVTISLVYYVEGLGHNLFSVGQFCDSDLEVDFHQHTCFIRNLEGIDLLTGSRGNNLYTLSLQDMMASSPISRQGLVRGLSKPKFEKDHLYSACAMGKSTKKTHKPKSEDTNQEILYLLHMDLYGPMRVESINGKKYILDYYEEVGISHETSGACSPQQNEVVERRNRTLIEAAHTMLIYAQAPLFLWAEVVETTCYTQNRSIICLRHGKTPYELLHSKLPDLSFFHLFRALCNPINDSENLGKLQPKADIGIFIGYASTKKAFRIYNRHTRRIVETIHVDFDELTALASEQSSSRPALHDMTPGTIKTQSLVIPQDVGDDNLDMEVAHMGSDSLIGIPIPNINSEQSTIPASPQATVQTDHPLPHNNSKWTKDHPLNNIIGQLDRPVSTRLQLHEQALFCYYDAFMTSIEPKTYKEALTQSCWIKAMQE